MAGLAQAVVAQPAPGPLDRGRQVAVGLGELGQAVERADQAVAPGVLGLDRPLVGDLRQEGPRGELHRGLERGAVAGRQQALGLLGVDPARQVGGQAGAGAIGHQVVAAARGLQRPADAPEGAAQRGAGARVEHVRPEDPRQPRARLHAGPHEQVRQQGPRLDAGHVRDGPAVDLDGEPAEQSGAEHPGHLGPGPPPVNPARRRQRPAHADLGRPEAVALTPERPRNCRGPAIGEGIADPPSTGCSRLPELVLTAADAAGAASAPRPCAGACRPRRRSPGARC